MANFLLDNCIIAPLTLELINECEQYHCSKENDIEKFFHSEFGDYNSELLGKTYCFVTQGSPRKMVCAFTVSNSSINVSNLSNRRRKKIDKSIPHRKHHPQYPAVLVGQLAVFDEFRKKGIGVEMMNFIKSWFIDPLNKTGCRFVIVDALNKKPVIDFYRTNGFETVFETEEEENSVMKKVAPRRGLLQIIKDVFGKNKISNRVTRLMFFDLILLKGNK